MRLGNTRKGSKVKTEGEKDELEMGARCAAVSRELKVIKHTNKIRNPLQNERRDITIENITKNYNLIP